MLPDRDCQLLTAYVDGELSSRQRRHAERLLKRSREARALLRLLRQDAAVLRSLTPSKLDIDLSPAILQTIRERGLTPKPRQPKLRVPLFPTWAATAIAASVLCAIGLASYLGFGAYLSRQPSSAGNVPVVNREQPERPAPPGSE